MVFKETIEIFYRFFQVSALAEDIFWDFDQTALFVGNDRCSSRDIIDQRDFSKWIPRIVVDTLLFPLILLILSFHIVNTFQHNIKILSFIAFLEHHFIYIMLFQLKIESQFAEYGRFQIEGFLDEYDFLTWMNRYFKDVDE